MSVDDLWMHYSKINNKKTKFPAYHSFDNVILALNYLFLIDAININSEGYLYKNQKENIDLL